MKFTGITNNTTKRLILDAGVLIKGFDPQKTVQENMANVIGATEGGGNFSSVPTVHNIVLDGAPTHVKGLERVDDWVVTISATVKEHTVASLKLALGAAKSETATVSSKSYTKITGKPDFEENDYIDNVAWVGKLSGSEDPIIIVLKNVLSINGVSLSFTDKNEAGATMTLTAHYDIGDLETPPVDYLYPEVA